MEIYMQLPRLQLMMEYIIQHVPVLMEQLMTFVKPTASEKAPCRVQYQSDSTFDLFFFTVQTEAEAYLKQPLRK
jgi:hypothetical protein